MRGHQDRFLSSSGDLLRLTINRNEEQARVFSAVQNIASGIQANGTTGFSSYNYILSLYLPFLVKEVWRESKRVSNLAMENINKNQAG